MIRGESVVAGAGDEGCETLDDEGSRILDYAIEKKRGKKGASSYNDGCDEESFPLPAMEEEEVQGLGEDDEGEEIAGGEGDELVHVGKLPSRRDGLPAVSGQVCRPADDNRATGLSFAEPIWYFLRADWRSDPHQ